jgi:hypothetical protein
LITAIYQEVEVEILKATGEEGMAEVITIDGSTPFRVISSSSARKYGAPAIVWLSGGKVGIDELSDVRCNGVEAMDYMLQMFGDRVGMDMLKMTRGEELPY